MEPTSLLQSFAIAKDGSVVSVKQVERGQACECICPACRAPLIARQGDVRVWHFAHTSDTDCEHGAESALHRAAKTVIERAGGIKVPGIEVTAYHNTPDGRYAQGTASRPATWLEFDVVEAEVRMNVPDATDHITSDIVGCRGDKRFIIEIGVTHFVDEDKRRKLKTINLPSLEIDLRLLHQGACDWDALEAAVVQETTYKEWLLYPDLSSLHAEAERVAQQNAAALPPVSSTSTGAAPRTRYRLHGRIVDLIERPFGIALWTPYDPAFNEVVKGWARLYGGQWQPKFKNWLFPLAAKPYLIADIEHRQQHPSEHYHQLNATQSRLQQRT